MQIWPLIHNAIERAREIHATTFLYTDKATLLAALLDAHDNLHDQFQLPVDERTYWTLRNNLKEITAVCAVYAEDADHGPSAQHNPTAAILCHWAGAHATDLDDTATLYAHWETFKAHLTNNRNALDLEITTDPAHRDHDAILDLLTDTAAKAALFCARARLTIHDQDPHAQTNFAVVQWQDPDWAVLANYCDYGYVPDLPTTPGDFPGETQCRPCLLIGPRGMAPARTPTHFTPKQPKTIPAAPYHKLAKITTERGVVTGATKLHYPFLCAMALSTNEFRLPLAIADHGLTATQRRILKHFNVTWIHAEEPKLPTHMKPPSAIAAPRAFCKPWLCLATPWHRSIWIDADALPLDARSQALDPENDTCSLADNRPFNPESVYLYEKLVRTLAPRGPHIHPHDPETHVNTGVLCWTKGDPLITSWRNHAAMIIAQPALHPLAGVRDQSAMFLALRTRRLNLHLLPAFLPKEWNWPADGHPAQYARNRKPLPVDPVQLLAVARKRHPGKHVVHWLGWPKPEHLYE